MGDGLTGILKNADPELLRKLRAQVDAVSLSVGTAMLCLQELQGTLGIILDGNQAGINSAQTSNVPRNVLGADIAEDGSEMPYKIVDGLVKIVDRENFLKLPSEQVVDIITENYHSRRPKKPNLRGVSVSDDMLYNYDDAAKALDITKANLSFRIGRKQIEKTENNEIRGYEIIKRHFRPDGRAIMSYQDFAKIIYVGVEVVEELARIKLLAFMETETYLKKGEAARFYDAIWKRYHKAENESRRSQVAGPVAKLERPITPLALQERLKSPPPDTSKHGIWTKTDDLYIPISRLDDLKEVVDFCVIPKTKSPSDDAYLVRYQKNPNGTREVNESDIDRLRLAKGYIPEEVFKDDYEKSFGTTYVKEDVINSLKIIGMSHLVYNKKICIPPGTLDIASLTEDALKKIAPLTKAAIMEHGQFMHPTRIKEIIGDKFNLTEFGREVTKGNLSFVEIDGARHFNTFQVVRFYEPVFRSLYKMSQPA